ncbi:MAG: NAD(P)/FAD-dependent oxidoreductase [Polyangiaceae bacterium]
MYDAIVIGAGPNGLTAAAHLVKAGWSVLVLETSATPGGAAQTHELTRPGFLHDIGAGFFPFGPVSPAFVPLALDEVGLIWRNAPVDSAHPSLDGSCAAISRDIDVAAKYFGKDGAAWRRLATWFASARDDILQATLTELPPLRAGLGLLVENALTLTGVALSSGRGFGESRFTTDAARRVVPGLALHADVGPDDPCGAIVGFMLAGMCSSVGFPVAEGGAGSITKALLRRVQATTSGRVQCNTRVEKVIVRDGRAVAVRTSNGDEIEAKRAILADTGAPALYLKLVDEHHVPSWVRRSMRGFKYGFGTFKVDWALDAPVPWRDEASRQSAVIQTGDSVDDLARFVNEVRSGKLPDHPYLVVGQQSLCDPTRAPQGKHTLYAYSRVPSYVEGGWAAHAERFADAIDDRIEGLAPGFKANILHRTVTTPVDLQRMNANLVGGDLGGGTADIKHQLVMKPVFPYFRYRTPVNGLYLASSYAHPGPGVHGMCGYNAALAALRDQG